MGPFALRHAHLAAIDLEQHRPAAACAGIECQEQLAAHASTAALLMTARRGSPAANRAISSATMVTPRRSVSCVAPPMWGVITTFSCLRRG